MPRCIIDGYPNDGIHNFGVRCRRPDTGAIWTPNTDAYLLICVMNMLNKDV